MVISSHILTFSLSPDYVQILWMINEEFVILLFKFRNRRRRAKALLDFERHDDDELGFRKNDIVTVSANYWFIILIENNSC